MRLEIICTGDEVLTGKIVNTNFGYMTQKLEDVGLSVAWETTVGDDRVNLLEAFRLAAARSDAVIVNGGLGPTVDDLSQEIAAETAGVRLVLHEQWLARMEDFFRRRGRVMSPNNRKQAMLPEGGEMLDNPIGTACGFAVTIGKARFFFTPGVPRELHRMLEEQIIPRLLSMSGAPGMIRLKRFHSYGLGESQVDQILAGVETLAPDGSVKLGFRAHYPQIETKLTVRGTDAADIERKLAPVQDEVRRRLGSFILAEDEQTLEGVILARLTGQHATLALAETFTGGQIAARLAPLAGAEHVFRRDIVARALGQIQAAVGLTATEGAITEEDAVAIARGLRAQAGATHAMAALIDLENPAAEGIDFAGTVWVAIATADNEAVRRARIAGGREWVRLGAVELALDCLRRHLQGLPLREPIDSARA
jgi:nicotinamide-nucleotide amidase